MVSIGNTEHPINLPGVGQLPLDATEKSVGKLPIARKAKEKHLINPNHLTSEQNWLCKWIDRKEDPLIEDNTVNIFNVQQK